MRDLVSFDLDGTLVDSAVDLASALNGTLAEWQRPGVSVADTRAMIGNGARRLLDRAFAATGGALEGPEGARALRAFMAHYERHCVESSALYPGAKAALEALAAEDHPLAVVTNKPGRFTGKLLEALGVDDLFVVVFSGDTLPVRKPDPAPLLAAMRFVGATSGVHVGDSETDVVAAKRAGMGSVAVGWGYASAPAETLGADAVAHVFSDVPPRVRGVISARASRSP